MDPGAVRSSPAPRSPGWWVAPLYLVLAAALVPWIGYLAVTLPDTAVNLNHRLTWVGFDLLLAVALTRTAWLAWRRSPFVVPVASATAALLVVDAWFDVTTAAAGADRTRSVLAAVLVELPLAVLSLTIAARGQAEIARTGAVRRRRQFWRFARRPR